METNNTKEEQILIRITGNDRPGLTTSIMEILASKDAKILDIGQADIHSTLSLGILIRIDENASGQVMKELLFKATELGVNIGFAPVTDDEYENWVRSGQEPIHTHTHRSLAFGKADRSRYKSHNQPRTQHRLHTATHRTHEHKAPGTQHACLHRVLAARHTYRPCCHAGVSDAHIFRNGD